MAARNFQWHMIGAFVLFAISARLLWSPLSSLQTTGNPLPDHVNSDLLSQVKTGHDIANNKELHHDVTTLEVPLLHRNISRSTRHDRRALMTYGYAVCKGDILWAKLQEAFAGRVPAGPQFERSDFSNGWSLAPGKDQGKLKERWHAAFKGFANDRVPTGDEVSHLRALQNKPFLLSAGYPVTTPTGGEYTLQYIPAWSAMLATFVNSPSNRLTDSFNTPYPQPVNPLNVPSLIPPLNRLSDVSWYIYNLIGNAAKIRYIGHDWINNDDTINIVEDIFTAYTDVADPDLPWPGLVFDVASEEGRALLATPNSLAIAWMMVDHAGVLGRRRPRVHVFNDETGQICLLWDLVPV
ncbi:MAG: hypothetical protein Q9226_005387 [Calogaya cf. arnoldii]